MNQDNRTLGQVAFYARYPQGIPFPSLDKHDAANWGHTAQAVVRHFLETRGVLDFIRRATLELQTHGSRTPAQMKSLFDAAYRLYVELDVEGRLAQPSVQEGSGEEWEEFPRETTTLQQGDVWGTKKEPVPSIYLGEINHAPIHRRKRPSPQVQDKVSGVVPRTVADQKEQMTPCANVARAERAARRICNLFATMYMEVQSRTDPWAAHHFDDVASVIREEMRPASAPEAASAPVEQERPSDLPPAAQEERKDGFEDVREIDGKTFHWKDGFKCPKCGGSHFGSHSEEKDGRCRIVERYCHDEFGKGCKWHGEYFMASDLYSLARDEEFYRTAYHSRDQEVAVLKEEATQCKTTLAKINELMQSTSDPMHRHDALVSAVYVMRNQLDESDKDREQLASLTAELEQVKALQEGYAKRESNRLDQILSLQKQLAQAMVERDEWNAEAEDIRKQLSECHVAHSDQAIELTRLHSLSTWVSIAESGGPKDKEQYVCLAGGTEAPGCSKFKYKNPDRTHYMIIPPLLEKKQEDDGFEAAFKTAQSSESMPINKRHFQAGWLAAIAAQKEGK